VGWWVVVFRGWQLRMKIDRVESEEKKEDEVEVEDEDEDISQN